MNQEKALLLEKIRELEAELERRRTNRKLIREDPLRAYWFLDPPPPSPLASLSDEELMSRLNKARQLLRRLNEV